MLSASDHEVLGQVGRGTPMGDLLRRYWVPALLSEEIPLPGGAPVRVRLLGEGLVAFRLQDGEVGLLRESCSHRGASLFFGQNEPGGLRCSYHGWKYDVAGRCVDMPNEPPLSTFKERVQHPAYPCAERGGIVWAYLGPPEDRPDLPGLEYLSVPESHQYVSKRHLECHWEQALEVDIDSAHVPWLHGELFRGSEAASGPMRYMLENTAPSFEVLPFDYGLAIAARRDVEDGCFWRINHWIAPWYTVVPQIGPPWGIHGWVPIDDTSCWVYSFVWNPELPHSSDEIETWKRGEGLFAELIPGTYVPIRNKGNDWLVDREAQGAGLLSAGVHGNQEQDDAIVGSIGPYHDRSQEHLVATDAAVLATRRWLVDAAARLQRDGVAPPRDVPCRARPVSQLLPAHESWHEALAPLAWEQSGEFEHG
jgi:phenylpropionate dioxygenase-like ring-hydroxylating dioxygenase large terminal subunit